MPKVNLEQLGVQPSKPLGGMFTAKEEFATYPFSLGPTGITAQRSGDGYTVSTIAKGSPAEGKLKAGDYIVGANGRLFSEDKDKFKDAERRFPNPQMGMAIEMAEANGGKLTLKINEGKTSRTIEIQLQPLGAMGEAFPKKSLKAEFLAATQAEILLAQQNEKGGWSTGLIRKGKADQKSKLIPTCMCAIALMSTGDEKYDPAIKKAFELVINWKIKSFHSWQYAYQSKFLTEYQLRYGDPRIKPAVQKMVNDLADGYFYYNGVYGYGHGLNSGNYRYEGINACTAHACYTVAMGRILGCEMPNQIDVLLAKSLERLAPDGVLDYFWRARRTGKTPSKKNENQGRTGTASMAYYYLGGRPEQYEKFIAYLLKNKEHADGGHATGGTLSWASSGLGLAMADDARFQQYMQSKVWQLALNRTWNYSYFLQPSPHGQHRGSDQSLGGHYISAANTILFNRHKKNLIMTGMKKGIPEVKPTYLTEVIAASDYYERQGRIIEIIEAINIMGKKTPAIVTPYLEKLKSVPLEAADYQAQIDKIYAAHLPEVARQVANTAMTEEQRSHALVALLGINYSRMVMHTKDLTGAKIAHLYTTPNLGSIEISTTMESTRSSKHKTKKISANGNKKLLRHLPKNMFRTDEDTPIKTSIVWNGLQMDFSFTYLAEQKKYLGNKEGIRGNWSKKPWEISYGPFYGSVKRTKTNGCLQVTYPDGTLFETALMKNALVSHKGETNTLDKYLKQTKQKAIPDGTKIHFSYFRRSGKPALPMCDEIIILE